MNSSSMYSSEPRSESLRTSASRATERAHEMADRVGSTLRSAADTLGQSAERALYKGDELAVSARRRLNERPLMALGAAFVLGFLMTNLMRRRHSAHETHRY